MDSKYFKVQIKNLPKGSSWQDLKDHMRTSSEVRFTEVHSDGTGIAGFSSREDMETAIRKLDDTNMKSHSGETSYIRIQELVDESSQAVNESENRRDRSRSRSRSARERSRSRSTRSDRQKDASPKRKHSHDDDYHSPRNGHHNEH